MNRRNGSEAIWERKKQIPIAKSSRKEQVERENTFPVEIKTSPASGATKAFAIPKSSIQDKDLSTNTTSNSNNSRTFNYDGTTSNNSTIGVYLDCIIVDMMRAKESSETVYPAYLKMYMFWAVLDRIKKCGKLTGTYGSSLPTFPPGAYIPKALFALLKYLGPYDYHGSKYSVQLTIASEPTFNAKWISSSGTGISYSTAFCIGAAVYDSTNDDYGYDNLATSSYFLSTVSSAWDGFSEYVAGTGMGIAYSELPFNAPDASFYTWYNGTRDDICCEVPDFNVVFGWIFRTTLATEYSPMFRKRLPDPNGDFGTTQAPWAMELGCATICNRMTHSTIKEKNGWNWCGHKLRDPFAIFLRFDAKNYTTIGAMIMSEMQSGGGTLTDNEVFSTGIIWRAMINRRLIEYGSLSINSATIPIQRFCPATSYLSFKVPIILAAILESIGPYVFDKTLYVPDLDYVSNSIASGTTIYAWPSAGNAAAQYNDNTMSILFAAWTFTPGAVQWNAGYNTRSATINQALWPISQLPFIGDIYTKMCERLSLNNFVTIRSKPLGELSIVCSSSIVSEAILGASANTRIPQTTFTTAKTNLFQFNGTIYSNIPIGSKDLMMALLYCRNLTGVDFVGEAPFLYCDPDNGNGLDGYIRVRQLVRDVMRSNSELTVELGNVRAAQKNYAVQYGTLEVGVNKECGWWCNVWNNWMRNASLGLAIAQVGTGTALAVQKMANSLNLHTDNYGNAFSPMALNVAYIAKNMYDKVQEDKEKRVRSGKPIIHDEL